MARRIIEKQSAEAAVLGCSILDSDAAIATISELKDSSFIDPRNKLIFQAMVQMNKEGKNIDLVNLSSALQNNGNLNAVGGIKYITELASTLPPQSEFRSYINQVKDDTALREYVAELNKTIEAAKTCTNIPSFIQSSQLKLDALSKNTRAEGFKETPDVVKSYLKKLEANANKRKEKGLKYDPIVTGLATGYEDLDRITSGFNPGELIILGARPGMGKTAFALNIAYKVATTQFNEKKSVAFFSLEMSAESIMGRLLALSSNLSQSEIKTLNLKVDVDNEGNNKIKVTGETPKEQSSIKKLNSGIKEMSKVTIYISDNPTPKVSSIRADIKKLLSKDHNLGLVIIDYLGLIVSADDKVNSNATKTNIVGDISRALKSIARDFQIPVLCLSQLSRSPDKRQKDAKEPNISDLRDSGDIEQDADQIYFLFRPDYYGGGGMQGEPNHIKYDEDSISEAKLIVAKNRNGKIGDCYFTFDKSKSKFTLSTKDAAGNSIPNEPEFLDEEY